MVDFFATWCGPCKLIAPVLEKIATTDDKVVILKVDVDENEVSNLGEDHTLVVVTCR